MMAENPQTPVYLKIRAVKASVVRFLIPEGATITVKAVSP